MMLLRQVRLLFSARLTTLINSLAKLICSHSSLTETTAMAANDALSKQFPPVGRLHSLQNKIDVVHLQLQHVYH